jgi:ATP-dependent DNA helicase RecQ
MRNEKVHAILKQTFGHDSFRFDQLDIINNVLDGKDTIAIMPTGGGKSVCYQVPALYFEGVTIVVSPLISLMQDQVQNLAEYGVEACFLNSTQTGEERMQAEDKIIAGEVKLVYVSPEGLLTGSLASFFRNVEVSLIAIDEAHCVSQWGHEFRNDYTRLGELKEVFLNIPFLALTATADSKTRDDMAVQLLMADPKVFVSSFDRPNIKYSIYERVNEIKQLDSFIKENHPDETGIVYCLSRRKVEKTAKDLCELGHDAVAYHAGLSVKQRERAQKAFNIKQNTIVVATIAFGMGIDKPDVRFVAHLDLPKSIEGYYQETGRAGRDGLASNAWMVYGLQDVVKLSQMLETTDASDAYKKVARHKLDAMVSLCETATCRREYLLSYFEEKSSEHCGLCDSCLEPADTWDATVDAQKVLSTIFRTGQVFGAGYLIDVLRGSQNAKVMDRGHDKLSVYGIGKDESKQHWSVIIRQLLNAKFIGIKNWEYRNLYLTQKSSPLLKGEMVFNMRKIKESAKSKPSSSSSSTKNKKIANDNHGRTDLFEALRTLRSEFAKEKNVPPYVIFGDKSLHDMCHLMPSDRDQFLMVNGVGESKCETYAQAFIEIISSHS